MIVDKNFRGLGQRVEFSITKEDDVKSLPSIKLKWKDNSIGKESRIFFNYELEHVSNQLHNVLPIGETLAKTTDARRIVQSHLQKTDMIFSRYFLNLQLFVQNLTLTFSSSTLYRNYYFSGEHRNILLTPSFQPYHILAADKLNIQSGRDVFGITGLKAETKLVDQVFDLY